MSARQAFGPNLRRIRLQRGITLERIAEVTKVSVELWDALEHNDCSRWLPGIFARAHIRAYARLIDVDPEATVDEFCRWFPQGDRRALRFVREHAEIVGHQLEWREGIPPDVAEGDRRESALESAPPARPVRPARLPLVSLFLRLRRVLGKA